MNPQQTDTEEGARQPVTCSKHPLCKYLSVKNTPKNLEGWFPDYFIAMTPRTGSTALCHLARLTSVLGFPEEYLNPREPIAGYLEEAPSRNLREYFTQLRIYRATPNGVFGVKLPIEDLRPLYHHKLIERGKVPSKFIYLTRDDLDLQAVSLYLAETSGKWHDTTPPDHSSAEFSESHIRSVRATIERQMAEWERFFTNYEIVPLRITYEQFVHDAHATVEKIADHVGVALPPETRISLADCPMVKLGGTQNELWATALKVGSLNRSATTLLS